MIVNNSSAALRVDTEYKAEHHQEPPPANDSPVFLKKKSVSFRIRRNTSLLDEVTVRPGDITSLSITEPPSIKACVCKNENVTLIASTESRRSSSNSLSSITTAFSSWDGFHDDSPVSSPKRPPKTRIFGKELTRIFDHEEEEEEKWEAPSEAATKPRTKSNSSLQSVFCKSVIAGYSYIVSRINLISPDQLHPHLFYPLL